MESQSQGFTIRHNPSMGIVIGGKSKRMEQEIRTPLSTTSKVFYK
jgi:hypothetical protein